MKTFKRISTVLIFTLLSVGLLLALGKKADGLRYPKARKADQVDDYHGIKVADPYRWMEAMTSPETKSWVDAQEKLFDGYVKDVAFHNDIKQRILQIRDVDSFSMPTKKGGRYFFTKTEAGQNQGVVFVQANLSAEPKVLLHPKKFLKDPETRLAGYSVSPDGNRIFYSVSRGQSRWTEDHIMDVDTKKVWPETLTGVGGISWTKEGEGFYYVRYKVPEKGKELQARLKDPKIYFHEIGTPQSEDKFVYARPDNPTWLLGSRVTHDGKYLIITVAKGSSFSGWVDFILYKDLENSDSEIVKLVDGEDAKYAFEGSNGSTFWIRTTLGAPRGRVVAVHINKPERENWVEVIPQSEETINTVSEIGDYLVLRYLRDALPVVKVFDHQGKFQYEVGMPSIALVGGFPDDRTAQEAYYQLWGLLEPGTIYKLDLKTGKSTLFKRPQIKFTPEDF
ncbi:S9 family peptidase, partial [candidate division KSB1 bacterium]|nr:S9 family peptidase [candidate division KSB1 bacterium]NIV68542.1 S9 family peptidase [Phycisphaerae bacterium]NIR69097.1 S9 family peptidase [candidate division KSB1 bacterium]NIS22628.1 S9 family peptidase [candidate division KSB1 bacterium]NIT69486.1 S9 family peptidase [candidate division KSB1 bacterium]